MTVWLTVVTMALAIPGGLLLALDAPVAASGSCRCAATAFVEFFRATPLILQIYWVYYVLPAYFDVQLSQIATAIVGPHLQHLRLQFRDVPLRHRVDPARPVECRPGARHAHARGLRAHRAAAGGDARAAGARLAPGCRCSRTRRSSRSSRCRALLRVACKIRAETYRILEVLTAMAAIYWLMGYPQAKLVDWIHRRFRWSNERATRGSPILAFENVVEALRRDRRARRRQPVDRARRGRLPDRPVAAPESPRCCAAPTRSSRSMAAASCSTAARCRAPMRSRPRWCAGAWAWCSRISSCSRI